MKKNNPFNELFVFLEPFLFNKRLTVVDVGANEGSFIEGIVSHGYKVHEYIGVEPDIKSFEHLQNNLRKLDIKHPPTLINGILGESAGTAMIKSAGTMTKVVCSNVSSENMQEVCSHTLDEIQSVVLELPVSLIKIDVEGFEKEVIRGGDDFFAQQNADFVMLEVGFNKKGRQQVYFNDIVELMEKHDYRLVRIFEQKNEWISDSLALRRANFLFSSALYIQRNPLSIRINEYEKFSYSNSKNHTLQKINKLKHQLNELELEIERLIKNE